jgi:tetratricopeptide (TPR) repeat protein
LLSRKAGNIAHEILASGNLIDALLPLGDLMNAEACLTRIQRLANELEDPGSSIQRVKRLEATVLFYKGEWQRAISLLRPLQAEFRQQNHLMALFITDSLLARALIEMYSWKVCTKYFDWDEVESALAEAIQLGQALAETDALIWCHSRLAVLNAAQDRIKEARDLLSKAHAMAKDWPYPSVETASLWGEAKLAIAEFRWEKAIYLYGSLVEIYRHCSMRWDQARTLVELASAMISQGDASHAHQANMLLQEAQTLYREMGLPLYITLVQEQLGALSN